MKKGDIVQFRKILFPGEEELLMIVEEVYENYNRVLVRTLIDLPIQPTNVYSIDDLTVIEEKDNKTK